MYILVGLDCLHRQVCKMRLLCLSEEQSNGEAMIK